MLLQKSQQGAFIYMVKSFGKVRVKSCCLEMLICGTTNLGCLKAYDASIILKPIFDYFWQNERRKKKEKRRW